MQRRFRLSHLDLAGREAGAPRPLLRALTSIVPHLACLLVMMCILAQRIRVIATSPAYHDQPAQRLLLNVPGTISCARNGSAARLSRPGGNALETAAEAPGAFRAGPPSPPPIPERPGPPRSWSTPKLSSIGSTHVALSQPAITPAYHRVRKPVITGSETRLTPGRNTSWRCPGGSNGRCFPQNHSESRACGLRKVTRCMKLSLLSVLCAAFLG